MFKIINFIKDFHPMSLQSYRNSKGELAIGWNHTLNVYNGLTCSEEKATQWLEEDIKALKIAIPKLLNSPLSKTKEIALFSLIHEIGIDTFYSSKLRNYLNNKQIKLAGNEFLTYNKNGNAISINVLRRRQAEQKLFLLEEENDGHN